MSQTKSKYPNDLEQTKWLVATQAGDRMAFNHIVEKYQRPIYHFCYRLLENVDEAEDATQETFLRAYANLHSYDNTRLFSTWLFSIAANHCTDLLRRRRIRSTAYHALKSQHDLAAEEITPERLVVEAERLQETHTWLTSLPSNYYAVIVLKYWHALSYVEIAQTLNTTISAVKSQLFRAKKMMAQAAAH